LAHRRPGVSYGLVGVSEGRVATSKMSELASLKKQRPDCWMCTSLLEPEHLVFFESRCSVGKLNPDQYFKGYSFLTLKWHSEELYEISDRDRRSFLEDMSKVARALSVAFKPDKMNYELLGNGMPHLHWHLVPRYKTDAFWGRPIWAGSRARMRLTREDYEERVKLIKDSIQKN
jgi:diadenosine tetraphosphate (Ap4A) HIT family hydrolase